MSRSTAPSPPAPVPAAVTVGREPLTGPDGRALVAALDAELEERYGAEVCGLGLAPEEVAPGRGVFLVARWDGEPVGCGALRKGDGDLAEVRRMYVAPAARGHRIATAVLRRLEAEARRLGAGRLLLETGPAQPEALSLYRREGFRRTECAGPYADSSGICMEKLLST